VRTRSRACCCRRAFWEKHFEAQGGDSWPNEEPQEAASPRGVQADPCLPRGTSGGSVESHSAAHGEPGRQCRAQPHLDGGRKVLAELKSATESTSSPGVMSRALG